MILLTNYKRREILYLDTCTFEVQTTCNNNNFVSVHVTTTVVLYCDWMISPIQSHDDVIVQCVTSSVLVLLF